MITDGEQTRLDFNLSFYGFLDGIELEGAPPRRFGPPAHDQRGRHADHRPSSRLRTASASSTSTTGCGVSPLPGRCSRRASPGPYTLSGRLIPGGDLPDRWAVTEALLPIVQRELVALIDAGCAEITVDEPSMSCYAHREDPARFVDIFNRTVAPVVGRDRLSTHLCFGNYKGHAVGLRRYAPMFPAFHEMTVDELHVEMASREIAELDVIGWHRRAPRRRRRDRRRQELLHRAARADRRAACASACGMRPPTGSRWRPTAASRRRPRWAARQKLANLVAGVQRVRDEVG